MSIGQPNLPQDELQRLREEVQQLQLRLRDLNRRLDEFAARETAARELAARPPVPRTPPPVAPPRPAVELHPLIPKPPAPPPPIPPVAPKPVPAPVRSPPPVVRDPRLTIEGAYYEEHEAARPRVAPPVPPVAPPPRPPPPLPAPRPSPGPPPVSRGPSPTAPAESFEMRLGTFWLPRIGMLVLLTGFVFLVTWSYRYMTVPYKVALAYACCLVLGVLGLKLEKKMPQLGWVMQAGALALTYWLTYAAHFVKVFRVIESPGWAMVWLSVVVVGIVVVAQRRQSPIIAGMALFFGYYTSILSGVATFTLAADAVLALAALYFLARNRWVPMSFAAVLATYLTYALWVWKLSRWGELGHLIFDSGYLSAEDFRLRASFLSMYWLLFAAGGLIIRAEAMNLAERNGLLTLNNAFFFLLFSLLMYHTYPDRQWPFLFCFAGALFILSALLYQRFKPDRSLMDLQFLQGLAVFTLGLMSLLKGVQLVAALALESALVMVVARWMNLRWVAWIGRAVFAVAAYFAWDKYPGWNEPMIYGVWFAAAMGFVCARLERWLAAARGEGGAVPPVLGRPESEPPPATSLNAGAVYFALVSTVLAMVAGGQHFSAGALPWVWIIGAVVVALAGLVLRTREIVWSANLPLLWAHVMFYAALAQDPQHHWTLDQSLGLIAVTVGFGVFVWSRVRAADRPAAGLSATESLIPYALAGTVALIATTVDHCPDHLLLLALAVESLVLLGAGFWLEEPTWQWLGRAPLAWAHVTFYWWKLGDHGYDLNQVVILAAATFAFGVALWRRARRAQPDAPDRASVSLWPYALIGTAALMVATVDHCSERWLLVALAGESLALLAVGLWLEEPAFRWTGLAPLAWAHVTFYGWKLGDHGYELGPALVLVAATFAFGLALWRRERIARPSAPDRASTILWPFALIATALLLVATVDHCRERWLLAVMAGESLALLAGGLSLKEPSLAWVGLVPLAWAHGTFYNWRLGQHGYALNQALLLIAGTFAYGLVLWGRERALPATRDTARRASRWLWPFAVAAMAAVVVATLDHAAASWRLTWFAGETLVLVVAAVLAGESVFVWLGLAATVVGAVGYLAVGQATMGPHWVGWTNAMLGLLLFIASERTLRRLGERLPAAADAQRTWLTIIVVVVAALALQALHALAATTVLTVSWAVCGFVLLALGFAVTERRYRVAGLVVLGFSLARAVIYDFAKVETIYRILSFIGLGVILLVLAFLYTKNRDRIAKWL